MVARFEQGRFFVRGVAQQEQGGQRGVEQRNPELRGHDLAEGLAQQHDAALQRLRQRGATLLIELDGNQCQLRFGSYASAEVLASAPFDASGELPAMLAAPLFHARLLAEAKPVQSDRVLVVDGGSGYLPALIEGLAGSVTVVTPDDAMKGGKKGDYTLLLIDGAVEQLPEGIAKRLSEDARVVTGLIDNGVTRLAIGRKSGGTIALLPLAELGIPRLSAFDKPKAWSF